MLKVQASANWTGPPGACDDGLGQSDPKQEVYSNSTLVSERQNGTAYVLKQVQSGGKVQYQITPTSSATTGTCNVSVSVTLTPITLDLSGGLMPDTQELLVGEQLVASVDLHGGPSSPNDTYNWTLTDDSQSTMPGVTQECDPFTSWFVVSDSSTSCHTVYDGDVVLNQPSMQCSFRRPDKVKVQCSVNLSGIGSFTVQSDVIVNWPDIENEQNALGVMQIYNHDDPSSPYYDPRPEEAGDWLEINGAQLYDPDTVPFGIWYRATITTPDAYVAKYGDSGGWNYTQVIDSWQAQATDMNGQAYGMAMNGQSGLDGAYPYLNIGTPSNTPWPADGTQHTFEDKPGSNIDTFASCSLANSFSVNLMYIPPGNGQFVPLRGIDWYTNGTATWLGGNTYASSSCHQGDGGVYNGQPHPSWTQTLAPAWVPN